MLRRLPVIPTLLVLIAVGVMVRLGFWQLDRMHQKEAALAQLQANASLPVLALDPGSKDETLLFRPASSSCSNPRGMRQEGAGSAGTRYIVECDGGLFVQLGTATNPGTKVSWPGGAVTGTVSQLPDHRTWIEAIRNPKPVQLMLIADPPLAGLAASARPDPADIPNNHWSYAVQWFLFALTALVIYGLALRKRLAAGDGEG